MSRLALFFCILIVLGSNCLGHKIKPLSFQFSTRTLQREGKSIAWIEFSSDEGHFSALFPGTPSRQVTQLDTKAGQVPNYAYVLETETALYVIAHSDLPEIPSDPSQQSRMLDAGRDRMLAGDENLHLISESDTLVNGHHGREWVTQDKDTLSIGRSFLVKGRIYVCFYAMMNSRALKSRQAPPTSENRSNVFEANSRKFLDSLRFTEAVSETPGEVDRMLQELKKQKRGVVTIVGSNEPVAKNPTSVGVLNGKAVHLGVPEYPAIARRAHASGQVSVKVLINLEGNVAAAQVVDGHPLLRVAAVTAARESKFTPTQLDGKPVMVLGIIIYNFAAQ